MPDLCGGGVTAETRKPETGPEAGPTVEAGHPADPRCLAAVVQPRIREMVANDPRWKSMRGGGWVMGACYPEIVPLHGCYALRCVRRRQMLTRSIDIAERLGIPLLAKRGWYRPGTGWVNETPQFSAEGVRWVEA